MFATFENGAVRAHLDEYSEINIGFHQTIIRMSGNSMLINLAENLFTHMRMIRRKTIGEKDRADRSIRDHMHIIEALEARDTVRAGDAGARSRARPRRARGEIRRLSGLIWGNDPDGGNPWPTQQSKRNPPMQPNAS